MAQALPATPWKPSKEQLAAALTKRLPDLLRPGLSVVFCGINPGLYSAAVGRHFGRPGNRFWPALHLAGFTPERWTGFDDHRLLDLGFGATNIVARTTATAAELEPAELRRGARSLKRKVLEFQPRFLAVLGLTAYRTAFDQPTAVEGLQPLTIGATQVWLLPNPSGLNAHHTPATLAKAFAALKQRL